MGTRERYRGRAYWRWSLLLLAGALAVGLAGASGVGAAPAAQTPQSPGAQRQDPPGQLVQSPTPTPAMAILPPQTAPNGPTTPVIAQPSSPSNPPASPTPTPPVAAAPPQNAAPQNAVTANAPPAPAPPRSVTASGVTIGPPNNLRMLSRGPDPGTYTLAWDPPTNESVTEYRIVTVGAGGDTPQQFRVPGNVTQQVIGGLNPSVGFVLAVVAVDTQGREGPPSNTVQTGLAPTATPVRPPGATVGAGLAAPSYGGAGAAPGAPYPPTGPAGVSGPGYGGASPNSGSPYAPAGPPVPPPGPTSPGMPTGPLTMPPGPGVVPPGYNAPTGAVPYGAPIAPQSGMPPGPPYVRP